MVARRVGFLRGAGEVGGGGKEVEVWGGEGVCWGLRFVVL